MQNQNKAFSVSKNIMLSDSQKKSILKSFKELDMHKELEILFSKMYPKNTSVYITHGKDEMGRDLIISIKDPTGVENIAVVVKMDKISGSASEKSLFEIVTQVNQCFQVPKSVKDQLKPLLTNRVYVCIFGEISNKVEDNLNASLRAHEGKYKLFDIEKMLTFFTEYYPNIFLGASTLEALHNKYDELECKMLAKNKLLKTSYIEPNLRMYKKSKEQLLAISKSSDASRLGKTIGDNIFGEKETISSIAAKALSGCNKILIEGEAGSGKTIFVLKLTMHIIEETIHHINVTNKSDLEKINTPIVIKAITLNNGKTLLDIIDGYYEESVIAIEPSLLIIDGMDEVDNPTKEDIIQQSEKYCNDKRISLIFTSRKSTEVKKNLPKYENYELLPFETSHAINYIKKVLSQNKTLMGALIKGLEQLKHQIPLYPMSLSLLIEIAETQKEVPASISELYKRYIDLALSQYSDGEQINVLFEPGIKKDFFESISYEVFYKNNLSAIKKEAFDVYVTEYIKKFPMITDRESFICDLERTSLIKLGTHYVEFLHKSFLDYFVASYFNNRQTDLHESKEFDDIYALYHTSLWEDVTYFYFGQKTRINKNEIIKILDRTPEEHTGLLKDVNQFMIGKLIQFAWHTDSEDKKYAIEQSISNILNMRKGLVKFVEDDMGMTLPKILGDVQMLHYIDEAYTSRFTMEEVKNIISDMFNGEVKDSPEKFYFATLYILENTALLGNDYTDKFLDNFLSYSEKMPPEISLPLVNIVTLFAKNNRLNTTSDQSKNLKKITQKMRSRYQELSIDYLSFKNKLDQLKIQQISKRNKK